jgi:hypothetical protein
MEPVSAHVVVLNAAANEDSGSGASFSSWSEEEGYQMTVLPSAERSTEKRNGEKQFLHFKIMIKIKF